jgi:2'-5' RNA ligase
LETVRSFIAIELGPEIQKELARVQNELKKSEADVKWVKPERIHLTLKFLGEVSPGLMEEVKKIIAQVVKNHKAFELQISQAGAFPKPEHPRVLWIGVKQGHEETVKLAQELEDALMRIGFQKEKRAFKAHLTLGRVRSAHNRNQLKELLQSVSVSPQTMRVEKLILFKSTLTPKGAIYQPLYEAGLA